MVIYFTKDNISFGNSSQDNEEARGRGRLSPDSEAEKFIFR